MKFNEKLMSIRKTKGLSQEELGMELQVSRQTISKWESGQSYPDFQRLVMLSDYFDMTLDELVKDIDVQDIRDKNLTDEKVASIYLDVENVKNKSRKGSVKNFVALVKNDSFLVRITDMTILIEKEFIYGSSKRPNPTDYYRKQHYQCG